MLLLITIIGIGLGIYYLWPLFEKKVPAVVNSVTVPQVVQPMPQVVSQVVPQIVPSTIQPTAVPTEYQAFTALLVVRDRLLANVIPQAEIDVLLGYATKLLKKE